MSAIMDNQGDAGQPRQMDEAAAAAVKACRKAGVRRTAWIIAAIAAVFFIASLLQGHFAQIAHW